LPTNSEYDNVQLGGSNSVSRGEGKMGRDLGDSYGQESGELPTRTPENVYPNTTNSTGMDEHNRQFSSDVNGDPKALLQQAREGVDAHADLMQAYGLNQPVATLGSHPWLRDELANPTELEPGNAEPTVDLKIPKRQNVRG
jgi:hypothetical protein